MARDRRQGTADARRGQARTRLARAAVIDAARSLFLERGYGATTIDAISALADVPAATIYRLFASKRGILKALLDVSIAGDHDDVPVADRPRIQALLAEADAVAKIAGFVANAVDINVRVSPLYRILMSAAASDSEAAALLEDLTTERQRGQRLIARSLARTRALAPQLRERDAADIIHALLSPELFHLLVVDRGWPTTKYKQWLTKLLVAQLLPATPGSPSVR